MIGWKIATSTVNVG